MKTKKQQRREEEENQDYLDLIQPAYITKLKRLNEIAKTPKIKKPPIVKTPKIKKIPIIKPIGLDVKKIATTTKRTNWKKYESEARKLTKLQPIFNTIEEGKVKCTHFTHFNSDLYYVIDHKISIWYGFKNGISIEDISSTCNLRWITSKENCVKGMKNFIDNKNKHLIDVTKI